MTCYRFWKIEHKHLNVKDVFEVITTPTRANTYVTRSHYNNYKSKHVGDSKSLQQLQEQTRR